MPRSHDIALIRTLAGPIGPIHVAATRRGIVAVEQAVDAETFAGALVRRLGATPERDDMARPGRTGDPRVAHLDRAARAIDALLAGRPAADPPPIDLADRPEWDQRVLAAVADIAWGDTASYGEIARRIGAAGAARAVGGALGRNPVTLLIPCHRVIAADGSIGGYGGDGWGSRRAALERKQALLHREGVHVPLPDG
jgi:methylated-DNA-[protein]-cysteine S-methyltransferase